MHKFKVGDVIVRKTQKKYPKPIQITECCGGRYPSYWETIYRGFSIASSDDIGMEIAKHQEKNYILYEDPEVMATKTLYSFAENGEQLFGTHVGTNSQNMYILEVKGHDTYFIKDPKELEEVLPYTFSVSIGGKDVHYQGQPDKIKKGDYLLISTGNNVPCIGVVTAVDTKNKTARSKFNGVKLVTEKV
jgi:hypothetical protein